MTKLLNALANEAMSVLQQDTDGDAGKYEIAQMERRFRGLIENYARKEVTRLRSALTARDEAINVLRFVCGEAYQFAGAVDAPVKVLDNLSACAAGMPLPHETFLPVLDTDCGAVRSRDEAILMAEDRGTGLISAERQRQMSVEGWTPEHDAQHTTGQLLEAAVSYARNAFYGATSRVPLSWPWEPEWWKPSADPIRNLVKAGALIAAEIDRLSALAAAKETNG